ncbi:AGE family epimerase/isomerase [Reinekea blandensis]|uniref:N-acyl-D-glucosamine 2-epimerase n=1 Tax=Reinekea blandensis MED297 TaxID=314283 RepID=A4BA77_9GAMM|nr:AGE family epimerase/isomerase [Reinekea blandensis]EAR10833.1 hypothetical protein MED297_09996 [Reinekea sp. MED297] [Reinekea blandensis MED297]
MKTPSRPCHLRDIAQTQLSEQILPVWKQHARRADQGVMGTLTADAQSQTDQPKGSIMNSRALWSFSLLHRLEPQTELQMSALRLYHGFCDEFFDDATGLVHWQLPVESSDTFALLAQTYAIYALSQFAVACNHPEALQRAEQLTEVLFQSFAREDGTFAGIYQKGVDPSRQQPDHIETCGQLHVLEALTQLYLARPSSRLKRELTALVDLFLIHIFPEQGDLPLLFNRQWRPQPFETSIGHNFEAPVLVALACRALKDDQRRLLTEQKLLQLTDHSLQTAQLPSGYFLYGQDEQDQWRELLTWWTQVEAANGLQWAYEITGKDSYLTELSRLWQGFPNHWADREYGDWHPQLDRSLQPAGDTNKGDIWRSLYHSTRACVAMKYGFSALDGPNNTKPNTPETHPDDAPAHPVTPY